MGKSVKERGWKVRDAQIFQGWLIVIPEGKYGEVEHPHCALIENIPVSYMPMLDRDNNPVSFKNEKLISPNKKG